MRLALLFMMIAMVSAIQYRLVYTVGDQVEFEKLVNEKLNEGWSLVGGVSVSIYKSSWNILYTQALTLP